MIEKILNKIHEKQDGLMDDQGNFASAKNEGAYHALCDLEAYVESLAKEPVSENLK